MILTCAFLGALFLILGSWQRNIENEKRKQTVSDLQNARQSGTHQAIAQHPQIQPYLCIGCGSCIAACPEDNVLGLVDGIARVIQGSKCIGHARCAEACPVGAIAVGLGDISSRPDIPILSKNLETGVPGLYIAGELGGIALIRHAVEQGARAVEDIRSKIKSLSDSEDVPDLLIVGAGPAGLSAALKAVQLGLKYRVIDEQEDIGGTVRKYPRRKLTLVQSVEIPLYGKLQGREYSKEDIVQLWEEVIRRHRIDVSMGVKLASLKKSGDVFEAQTSQGLLRSRSVVLALGRRGSPRKLGVPGEGHEKVLYQVMDAATYKNQSILVVGGGDSAVEAALGFANQAGNEVTLSYRKPSFFRLKSRNEKRIAEYAASRRLRLLFSSEVLGISPDAVEISLLKEASSPEKISLKNDFVFVLAGSEPPFPLLKQAGVRFGGDAVLNAVKA